MSDKLNATVFEFDEQVPQLKRAKKVNDAMMLKRVRGLEETQRRSGPQPLGGIYPK